MLPPSLPRVDVELYPVNNVPRRVGKPQAPFDIDCEASPSTFRIAEVTIKLISPGWRIETEDTIQQEAINRKMVKETSYSFRVNTGADQRTVDSKNGSSTHTSSASESDKANIISSDPWTCE
ncbi:hypothetical protein COH21_008448 [Aspergillus flavus]|nr:hypothetical protein COH21_008448 [Aspergillus flavus]